MFFKCHWTQDKITRSELDGSPMRWAGLVFDITDRKISGESQAHLAAIVESSQNAIMSKSLDGCIQTWNKGAENLFGYSKEEVIGKKSDIIVPVKDRPKMHKIYNDLILGGTIEPFETKRVRKDGTLVDIMLTLSPIFIEGKVIGLSAISQDITALKNAEMQRRESEGNFKALFNFMPLACYLIDNVEKGISDCNEEFLKMFDAKSKNDVIGKTQFDLSPEFQENIGKSSLEYGSELIEKLESNGVIRFEWQHQTFAGQIFLVDAFVRKYFVDGREHYLCILRDITHEKEVEKEQIKSQEMIRTIAENSTQALVMMNELGYCTYGNKAWLEMTGYTLDEIKAKPLHDLVHHHFPNGDPYPMSQCPIDRALPENFDIRAHEDIFFRKNGETFPVLCAASPIFENGKPVSTVLEVRDISQVKFYEREIRESEERLRLAAKATGFGTYDIDTAKSKSVCSHELFQLLNLDEETIDVPTIMSEMIIAEDRESYLQSNHELMTNDKFSRRDIQYRVKLNNGQIRWVHDIAKVVSQLECDGHRYVRIIGTIRDITDQKNFEYKLLEADEKKNRFLAMLAHELRNPLVPLRFGLDLLKSEKMPQIEATRATMERQTEHLIRLVDDLLDVSRISEGKFYLQKSINELGQIVADAVTSSKHHFKVKNQNFIVSIPEEPIYLDADGHRLMQVLSNLLTNASKYTPQKGQIELVAHKKETEVTIIVKDSGYGIPQNKLENIFEMFSQVDEHQKMAEGGLGIGLTLVKALVQLHGGSIEAHSGGKGKGSKFLIIFPCLNEKPKIIKPKNQKSKNQKRRPLSVLVVDDNPDVLALTRIYVRRLGHEVLSAPDGREAVAMAEKHKPDVILLDISMPEMDGCEAARLIRSKPWGKEIALIAATGFGQEEDFCRTKEAGFDYHLVKPVKPTALDSLFTKISSEMDKKKLNS